MWYVLAGVNVIQAALEPIRQSQVSIETYVPKEIQAKNVHIWFYTVFHWFEVAKEFDHVIGFPGTDCCLLRDLSAEALQC